MSFAWPVSTAWSTSGMSKIAIWKRMNGMGFDGTGWEITLAGWDCFLKSHWNTIHERNTVTGDIVPNDHDQYFPFTLGHYCSYFINKITLINLIYTVK